MRNLWTNEFRSPRHWGRQAATGLLLLAVTLSILGCGENGDEDADGSATTTTEGVTPDGESAPDTTAATTEPDTPEAITEPGTTEAMTEPTPAEVEAAFTAFLDERASSGVLIASAVQSVSFENDTLRVVFNPQAAGVDLDLFGSLNPFDNMAEFVGTPIAFANDEGARLRTVVKVVSTELSDGTDLGSLTASELYEMGTGERLPD